MHAKSIRAPKSMVNIPSAELVFAHRICMVSNHVHFNLDLLVQFFELISVIVLLIAKL